MGRTKLYSEEFKRQALKRADEPGVTERNACADPGAFHYQRHRPEKMLRYQLVSKHYPVFRQKLAGEGSARRDDPAHP